MALRQRWPDRTVTVRLQTNRPPSLETHTNQIISAFSVAEFLRDHWEKGPTAQDTRALEKAWDTIAQHTGLPPADFGAFVKGCIFSLTVAEPPGSGPDTRDWRHYLRQFDALHKAICGGQVKTDTELSFPGQPLEVIGTNRPPIRLEPLAVVEHLDVVKHLVPRLLAGGIVT